MAYLIHHTLTRNGIYTVGSQTPYPLMKKSLTDKSQCKKNSETKQSTLFPFKTNGRKCDFESPIHGVINSGKIEGAYFGQKSYIMTFSENKV